MVGYFIKMGARRLLVLKVVVVPETFLKTWIPPY
jgi:hypothetical protein